MSQSILRPFGVRGISMRIKHLLIGITLSLSIIVILFYSILFLKKNEPVDIIAMNHVAKSIEKDYKELKSHIVRNGVLDHLSYEIILIVDTDYEGRVNDAIKEHFILLDLYFHNELTGKIIFKDYNMLQKQMNTKLFILFVGIILAVWLVFCVFLYLIQRQIIKPFQRMQHFAKQVAQGNLDIPLDIQKNNYFGAFTESFDLMREELKRARQAEYQANISKKELIAGISHDIKTPISTIKAICELMDAKASFLLLEENKETSCEQGLKEVLLLQREKLGVVYKKADVVDQLISNMFHATMEELERLKIEPKEMASTVIEEMLLEINHEGKIHRRNPLPNCLLYCDVLRLNQVIDNIISNSYKYANTKIDVNFELDRKNRLLKMKIKDYGPGVPSQELPLICQKYYRGMQESKKQTQGSGLGMYLSKLFMEGMGGGLTYYNEDGFVVEISICLV